MTFRINLPQYNSNKMEAWAFEDHHDTRDWDFRLSEYSDHIRYNELTTRMPPSKYPRILVVGCANGAELAAVANQGYNATGLTLCCQEELNLAKSKGYDVRNMDMHDITFDANTFDCVYAAHSLEHSVSIWIALAEIWQILRPDGLLWITLPTPKWSDKGGPKGQHLMILDEWFMVPCLNKAGFEILFKENTEAKYNFLCKKMPIEKMESYHANIYRRLESLKIKENA
jgi:SAM-dependent methyltransferase